MPPISGGPSILFVEAAFTLIAVVISLGWPRVGSGIFRPLERVFGELARRRSLSVLVVGATAGILRLLVLPISPIPQPSVADEFSYLLAGDTFASGRLTNPTHPMWVHFETFHISQIPSYMSMYFPAQGMFLAAGKLLAGHPWWGVWASVALMCAAICWMLQGWLPAGWALFGAFLAVLRIALFSDWVNTYFGGAVPALGGTLLLGALPRLLKSFRGRDFFWMATGMSLLALSRPYEGLLVTIPALLAAGWRMLKQAHPSFAVLAGRAAPAAALLLLTVGFLGYYNYRLFGKVLTSPYSVNRQQYASAPVFIWERERPEPVYRHEIMREAYAKYELQGTRESQTPSGFVRKLGEKTVRTGFFYLGFVLLPPLAMLPKVVRDRRIRILVFVGLFLAIGLLGEIWLFPRYVAPFVGGVYAILMQSMRHLRARWRGAAPGLLLVRSVPVLCVLLAAARVFAGPLNIALPNSLAFTAYGNLPLGLPRAQVLADLEQQPGQQLVIVRYSPNHELFDDWVYNRADIDHAKVIWAREMDPSGNRELLDYFKNRKAWLVEPDFNPPRVSPYPLADAAEASRALVSNNAARASLGVQP